MVDSSRSIRRSYGFALSLVAVLSLGTHGLTASSLARGRSDAELVNVAGRQRMFSQRISAAALSHSGLGRQESAGVLGEASSEFESAHAWGFARPESRPCPRWWWRSMPFFRG
ncbi:MAG: type IV pili methyl-accepting chemotaxis transducer N-terminal domain-containing protein [Planctomycetota bacterium]